MSAWNYDLKKSFIKLTIEIKTDEERKEGEECFFDDDWWERAAMNVEAKYPEWLKIVYDVQGVDVYCERIEVYRFVDEKIFDPCKLFEDKLECLCYCLRYKKMTVQALDLVRIECPLIDLFLHD